MIVFIKKKIISDLKMGLKMRFHFSLLCIGEGNGNPLQCSCLENPRDGIAESDTTEVT